ncbi:MAG: hypothetical protein PVH29_00640 [Candidatus Zixiibacteriota bacterium]|jgi:hypothetical protein
MRSATASLLITAIVFTAVPALAASGSGYAGAWQSFGAGARPAAMGNAFAAVADDPAALFFNPAGLDQIPGGNVELTYHYPFADMKDISYAAGALSYNMSGRGFALGTFAAGVNYFKASGIPEATGLGLTGRTFSDYETSLMLGWGKGLGGNVVAGEQARYNLGIAVKIISTKVHEYQDGGFGVDAGILLRPLPAARVGIGLANLVAPNIELKDVRDVYPATARVGAAIEFAPGFLATAEGQVRKDGDVGAAAGAEATIAKAVALRAGYRYPEEMPSAGLGVMAGKYRFDVCWRPHADLGDSYVATACIGW